MMQAGIEVVSLSPILVSFVSAADEGRLVVEGSAQEGHDGSAKDQSPI